MLCYQNSNCHIISYTDANWNGGLDEHRFTSGYAFLINEEATSWSIKKITMYCLIYHGGRVCDLHCYSARSCLVQEDFLAH